MTTVTSSVSDVQRVPLACFSSSLRTDARMP